MLAKDPKVAGAIGNEAEAADMNVTSIIGNTKHLGLEGMEKEVAGSEHNQLEKIIKMNVLPLSYEFS